MSDSQVTVFAEVYPYTKSHFFDDGDEYLFHIDSTKHHLYVHCVRDAESETWVVKHIGFPVIDIDAKTTQNNINTFLSSLPSQGRVKDNALIVSPSSVQSSDSFISNFPTVPTENGSDLLRIPFKMYPYSYTKKVQPLLFEDKPTQMNGHYYLTTGPYIRFQKLHPVEVEFYEDQSSVNQKQFRVTDSSLSELEDSFQNITIE